MADWRARSSESDPKAVEAAARASMKTHVAAMVDFWNAGVPTLDYGNNIRQVAQDEGLENAFAFPGFVPAYIRPLFCRGIGPFRWCALSGDPEDIYAHRRQGEGAVPRRTRTCTAGSTWRASASPSRACRRGSAGSASATGTALGLAFNEMVRTGELKAPVVIGRDHLDCGSVASPNRETEAMRDGSDAVSDWPLLNALLNTASGATWVVAAPRRRRRHGLLPACRHGDLSATAPKTADRRLERVLWNDPATGVMRHADAGYEVALDCAREHGLDLPSLR